MVTKSRQKIATLQKFSYLKRQLEYYEVEVAGLRMEIMKWFKGDENTIIGGKYSAFKENRTREDLDKRKLEEFLGSKLDAFKNKTEYSTLKVRINS